MRFFWQKKPAMSKWRQKLWDAFEWGSTERMENYVAHHCRCEVAELSDGEFCRTASYLRHMGVLVIMDHP